MPVAASGDLTEPSTGFRRDLGGFDFTLLVIGAIIGADIYVVAGLAAQSLGPAQLAAWALAGVLAAFIGLAFVQCAAICPEVGGSYAYARSAFGPFIGFIAGWALYLGEWVALPVFPIAFNSYVAYFLPTATGAGSVIVKASLVCAVTGVNLLGARESGRLNDLLTLVKLVPLALLVLAAAAFIVVDPGTAHAHLRPFAPLGWGGFSTALLVIFWAYAGFELAVLPAGEVRNPARTLPRGLLIGMAIATVFYVLTALSVVVTLPWQVAAASPRPLADALGASLSTIGLPGHWGPAVMSIGALVSIVGVYDVFTLGVARLSYALASDGLFPRPFARLHGEYKTPWVGLAFQGVTSLGLALVGQLSGLISSSVFFLGICYVITALAALQLLSRNPGHAVRLPGLKPALVVAAFSGVYLSAQASHRILLFGFLATAGGVLVYAVRERSWQHRAELQVELSRGEHQVVRWATFGEHWLLGFVRRRRGLPTPWLPKPRSRNGGGR